MTDKTFNILIVEDDFYIRELYVRELTKEKYEVRTVGKVKEAFDEIIKKKPDLIMLDLMLPVRSGFDVLEKVKGDAALKDIKVVILSNLGEDEVIKKGFSMGADGYLIKSSHTPKQVVVEIEKYLKD